MRQSWLTNWRNEGFGYAGRCRPRLPIEELHIGDAFRADLVVEGKVIVELKSIEAIAPVHKMQVLTYLRLCGLHLGLLINFNVALLKDGFH